MTVESDLQKALAQAESLKGSYAVFANSTQDVNARNMYQGLQLDMQRHVDRLYERLSYIKNRNPAYKRKQQ